MPRHPSLLLGGGLAMAAASIVAGAGYALTPAGGPAGVRFGAFGDPSTVPLLAVGGLAGGFALLTVTVWLGLRARSGQTLARPVLAAAALTLTYAGAAAVGLWISFRADPPLPPSWDWIRVAHALGLAGAAAWLLGLASLRRPGRDGRIPRV